MSNQTNSNKLIAKNAIIVYIQLIVTMVVNLVMSRLVLQALGVSDFGLYNVVGGIIALFSVISASMSVTTTRFLNYEQGKPDGDVNKVFNQSNVLHILIAIVLLAILETIGVFYIYNYLNVESGKETDAIFVFQVSTIATCIGIINVPYHSLLVVFERFTTIALIEIFCVLLRLSLVIFLLYYGGNALRFYAISMSVITVLNAFVYRIESYRKWPKIIKWKLEKSWKSYKEQLFFSNWNLLGTLAIAGRTQGSAVIINFFFGTTVNAAYAIANAVLQQVNVLTGRLDVAVSPQITQNLGLGDNSRAVYLASCSCRFCVILMEIILVSLYVELDFVLKLWLGSNVPEGAPTFCRYMLLIAVISATSCGLIHYINALGDIKWFRIQVCIWYALSLFFGSIVYMIGAPVYIMMIFFVLSDIMNRISQFYLLWKKHNFSVSSFARKAYLRPFFLAFILIIWFFIYPHFGFNTFLGRLGGIFLTIAISTIFAFGIGLYVNEQTKVIYLLKNKLCNSHGF